MLVMHVIQQIHHCTCRARLQFGGCKFAVGSGSGCLLGKDRGENCEAADSYCGKQALAREQTGHAGTVVKAGDTPVAPAL